MESIQEGRGYGVNTGGKGLWSQYRREGVMESMQEERGYGVIDSIQEGRGYTIPYVFSLEHIPREPGDRSSGGLCSCSGPGGLV